jgi:hypothetical protein
MNVNATVDLIGRSKNVAPPGHVDPGARSRSMNDRTLADGRSTSRNLVNDKVNGSVQVQVNVKVECAGP